MAAKPRRTPPPRTPVSAPPALAPPAARPRATAARAGATRAAARQRAAEGEAAPAVAPHPSVHADGHGKAGKQRPVRDSFTMPPDDHALIAQVKQRALRLQHAAKKSEVLRAGLKVLAAMDDRALLAVLSAVPPLKTGRPRKNVPDGEDLRAGNDAGSPAEVNVPGAWQPKSKGKGGGKKHRIAAA